MKEKHSLQKKKKKRKLKKTSSQETVRFEMPLPNSRCVLALALSLLSLVVVAVAVLFFFFSALRSRQEGGGGGGGGGGSIQDDPSLEMMLVEEVVSQRNVSKRSLYRVRRPTLGVARKILQLEQRGGGREEQLMDWDGADSRQELSEQGGSFIKKKRISCPFEIVVTNSLHYTYCTCKINKKNMRS